MTTSSTPIIAPATDDAVQVTTQGDEAATTGTPGRGLGRAFGAQLTSNGLANLGDGVLAGLIPLAALELTRSPAALAALAACTWIPWLVLGLHAGALVDRLDRRTTQVVALLVRGAALLGGTAAALFDVLSIPLLMALVLAYGVTEVVADLAATALVPDLVPRERLAAANGRLFGVQQVANGFLGAPLAGVLILLGAAIGLGATAVLVLAAAVPLLFLRRHSLGATTRTTPTVGDDEPDAAAAAPHGQVREGLRFLRSHPVLRRMTLGSSLLNMLSSAYMAVFVLWVVQGPTSGLHLPPSVFPLLMVAFAGGALLGSLLGETAQRLCGEIPAIMACLVLSCALLTVPVWWANGWVTGVALALAGATNTIGNVLSMSLRQRLIPRDLLGRVTGAGRALAYGLMPVGAVAGGAVAQLWGLPATFLGTMALSLMVCAYLALTVRTRTVAEAEAGSTAVVTRS